MVARSVGSCGLGWSVSRRVAAGQRERWEGLELEELGQASAVGAAGTQRGQNRRPDFASVLFF